jgi:putative nucleotidyltransferase with HDIG domain
MFEYLGVPPNGTPQADAAERSHCQRVAAWSVELARTFHLAQEEQDALEQAALCHHLPPLLLRPASRNRLLRDLGIPENNYQDSLPAGVRDILQCFHRLDIAQAGARTLLLAAILESANALDEHFEWEPLAEAGELPDRLVQLALNYLKSGNVPDLQNSMRDLPALPAMVQKSWRAISRDDTRPAELEEIAASDPRITLQLIRAANAGSHRTQHEVKSVVGAVGHLGVRPAARIACAASLKPLFDSQALRGVWNHCLDVAGMAARLAEDSGKFDPNEAFLAGLVHDAGALPMAGLPLDLRERYRRVSEKGCEAVPVEKVFFGFTHASAGAMLAREWSLPPMVSEAVEFHHQPERTGCKLAALLYVADECVHPGEDMPSILRRKTAMKSLDMTSGTLAKAFLVRGEALDSLKFVV